MLPMTVFDLIIDFITATSEWLCSVLTYRLYVLFTFYIIKRVTLR